MYSEHQPCLSCVRACMRAQLLQSCPTLCDSRDCSQPGFSVHGILQARILEGVAMHSSRGSSPPSNQTRISCLSCIADRIFTSTSFFFYRFFQNDYQKLMSSANRNSFTSSFLILMPFIAFPGLFALKRK